MSDVVLLGLALATGVILGCFFFGGLWWTVQQLVTTKKAALVLLASLVLRTAVVLWGFVLVGGGQWQRLVVCLLGFVVGRSLVKRLTAFPSVPHAP